MESVFVGRIAENIIIKKNIVVIYMGQYPSIEAGQLHNFDYNEKLKLSAWDTYPPKNNEYYSGDRFFKVSRKHYPQYTRGYLYGYYEDVDYYKILEEIQYPIEIAF